MISVQYFSSIFNFGYSGFTEIHSLYNWGGHAFLSIPIFRCLSAFLARSNKKLTGNDPSLYLILIPLLKSNLKSR